MYFKTRYGFCFSQNEVMNFHKTLEMAHSHASHVYNPAHTCRIGTTSRVLATLGFKKSPHTSCGSPLEPVSPTAQTVSLLWKIL